MSGKCIWFQHCYSWYMHVIWSITCSSRRGNHILCSNKYKKQLNKLELSRVHHSTPHALSICRFLHRDRPIMLTISTSPAVGMVDGCGYDGQQKDAICDVRGPCLTIWSTFKPVCRWFRLIGHAYELLRYLDVEIWRFSWWQQTDGQTDRWTDSPITLPLHMCAG